MTREEYGTAYEKWFPRTVRFLQCRGLSICKAEEIAQDAWGQGWNKLSSLQDDSFALTWVNSIALNMFRSGLRKSRTVPLSSVKTDTISCSELTELECGLDVDSVLKLVRLDSRKFIVMRYIMEYDNQTISFLTMYTPDSVKMKVLKEVRKIKKIIRRQNAIAEMRKQSAKVR